MKTLYSAITLMLACTLLSGTVQAEIPQAGGTKVDSTQNIASPSEGTQVDTLQLVNGDQLTGRVLTVDTDTIVLQSDVLGKITLPRKQVAAIQVGKSRVTPVRRSTDEKDQPQQLHVSDATLIKELQARGLPINKLSELHGLMPDISLPQSKQKPEDVIQQLRTRGISPAEIKEVQTSVPLLALPGVRSYFDQTLQGLSTGRLDLHDIRQEALKARDGLKDIQKDLGPSGTALNGYLMILEGFLEQTDGPTSTINPPDLSSS